MRECGSRTPPPGTWNGFSYTYNSPFTHADPNDNLLTQSIKNPSLNATQSFTYDGVNRLKTASEPANWNQTYVYDTAGNRAVQLGSSVPPSPDAWPQSDGSTPVFNSKNQWLSSSPIQYGDARGNITSTSISGVNGVTHRNYTYDAEGRLCQFSDSGTSATYTYTYDGLGRRVAKTSGTTTTYYTYAPDGQLLAETGNPPVDSTPLYAITDQLGSTRLTTNSQQQVRCYDYLPFGEDIPTNFGRGGSCYGVMDTAIRYTGKERDAETGLDYSEARYSSGPQGRFMSPDPENAGADPQMPGTWNGYSYAANNPFAYTDPDGLGLCGTDPETGIDITGCLEEYLYNIVHQQWINSFTQAGQSLVDSWNQFRNNPNCTGTLTAMGQTIGASTLGAYSAQAGAGIGLGLGSPTGPGAVATAAGGAALFGAGGMAVGGYSGGGIGHATAGLLCSSSTTGNTGSSSSQGGGGGNNGWTNKTARAKAKSLGYKEAKGAPFNSRNQLTFRSGNKWITPDIGGHTGYQSWKVFDGADRLGTYNTELTVRLGK